VSEGVFLDANIPVSAAWRAESGLLALWRLPGIQLLTSGYAIVEADRNVSNAEQRTRLHRLVQRTEIVDEPLPRRLPTGITLPAKDVPILLAAIDSSAQYLLTGDKDHFGRYYGQEIEGVTVLRPATYLASRGAPS
jgi:predicted nucleic acid-binding protein